MLSKEPQNTDALVLRGRALLALKRNADAGEALRAAVDSAPDSARPILLLADFERREGNLEEAERLFRRLIEVEDTFPAHAALAGFLSSSGERDEEAEATYRESLELATQEELSSAYSLFANYLVSRKRLDEVEPVMRNGIERAEDPLPLIYGLARFFHSQGQTEKADAMIEEAAQSRPGDPEPLLLLSQYRGQARDLEGALEAAERAVEAAPGDVRARLRKAEVLVDIGYREQDDVRVAQGRAVVDAVLGTDEGNPEALFVSSKIAMAEGRVPDAVSSLRRVIDTRSDWPQAHFLMGSALFLQGDRNGARQEVARALELDANFTAAERLLARIHAAVGDHEIAIETSRNVLAKAPEDDDTRVVLAQSLVRSGRVEDALDELVSIPEERRGAEEYFAIGRTYTLLKDHDNARTNLLRAQEFEPARYGILAALLDLDLRDQRLPESAARIANALRAKPDDAQILQLHGQVQLYGGNAREAESAFRRAIEMDPNDLSAYQNLARYLAVTGKPDEVIATYEDALEANPQAANLHLIVGSLYELQGKQDAAIERYESAIGINPNLAVAKNNLAYLISEKDGNLDRALDLAQEAKALLPDNPNAADTLGWVLYKKGVHSAAIGYLREAEGGMSPQDPQLAIVRHHLAQAYEANGETEEAKAALDRAIRDLDSLFADAERPEPEWTQEVRAMHERLGGTAEVAAP